MGWGMGLERLGGWRGSFGCGWMVGGENGRWEMGNGKWEMRARWYRSETRVGGGEDVRKKNWKIVEPWI